MKTYLAVVELDEDTAYDHEAAARAGFIAWFTEADKAGLRPFLVAGSAHLKLNMRTTDDGKFFLHVSGPVLDPKPADDHD